MRPIPVRVLRGTKADARTGAGHHFGTRSAAETALAHGAATAGIALGVCRNIRVSLGTETLVVPERNGHSDEVLVGFRQVRFLTHTCARGG